MSDAQRSARLWAIHDGNAGNARQALALARALGWAVPYAPALRPPAPWRWTAPRWLPGAGHALGVDFSQALPTPPPLVIGCGRQAALATRVLRGHGATAVQILDPRIALRHWDALVVPEHDGLRGANVITLLGSLHPVDDAWLAAGRVAFPALAVLPSPRIALLLGGPTARVPWDAGALAREVATLVHGVAELGGSIIATTSRRTPAAATQQLREALQGSPSLLWTGAADGPNPYAGLLGWAEAVVCTADSSNLLSEACATRVPVRALFEAQAQGRAAALLAGLRDRGRLLPPGTLQVGATVTPLRETERVAALLRERIAVPAPPA